MALVDLPRLADALPGFGDLVKALQSTGDTEGEKGRKEEGKKSSIQTPNTQHPTPNTHSAVEIEGLAGPAKGYVLARLFARDIEEGIQCTTVKAAIIKVASNEPTLTGPAETVFRAAARAHRRTGVPISTHTDSLRQSGLDQQRVFAGKQKNFVTVTGRGFATQPTDLRRAKYLTFALTAAYVFFSTVLPLGVLIMGSFMKIFGVFIKDPFTLNQWQMLLDDPRLLSSIENTLILSFVAATAGMILYFFVSYIVVRTHYAGRQLLDVSQQWIQRCRGHVRLSWVSGSLQHSSRRHGGGSRDGDVIPAPA